MNYSSNYSSSYSYSSNYSGKKDDCPQGHYRIVLQGRKYLETRDIVDQLIWQGVGDAVER